MDEMNSSTDSIIKKRNEIITNNDIKYEEIEISIESNAIRNEEVLRFEANGVKDNLKKSSNEVMCKIGKLENDVENVRNQIEKMEKMIQQYIVTGRLRENAMLGRLDNYKDEIYEMRKMLGIQTNFLMSFEGKIRDAGNQTSNTAGICDAHVMQLNSSISALFGIIDGLKKNLDLLLKGQMDLEKKVAEVNVKIEKKSEQDESVKKKAY
jgi:Mg2+ and Co2+ transporter CorA